MVPFNAWWRAGEAGFALDDCTPRLAIIDGERWAAWGDELTARRSAAVVVRAPAVGPAHAWTAEMAAALDALEAAITATETTLEPDDAGLDRKAILAEIGRIDAQIAGAMKSIEMALAVTSLRTLTSPPMSTSMSKTSLLLNLTR